MTAVADALQTDVEGISQPRAVVVGIMAGEGVQIGVLLDANAPVSVMTEPLLKVVNSRLRELGETPLEATGRGRWALCLVDGTPLRATQSLTEQDVYDGDRLWIRFLVDTEKRSQVVEHISTAVSQSLSKRFAAIDPVMALQVGATMVASGVTVASALLLWYRWHHNSWLTTIFGLVIGAVMLFNGEAPGYGVPLPLILGMAMLSALVIIGGGSMALRARRRPVVTGREQLIGSVGTVLAVEGDLAWALVHGERWKVRGPQALEPGERVRVHAVHGLELDVQRISHRTTTRRDKDAA